jgi:hypothetical protein
VQREISVLWREKKGVLRQTPQGVTPWGGLGVGVEFLRRRVPPCPMETLRHINPTGGIRCE